MTRFEEPEELRTVLERDEFTAAIRAGGEVLLEIPAWLAGKVVLEAIHYHLVHTFIPLQV
jgi:hypothetical protein